MRKLTVALMVASLILGGISFAVAAEQPEALNGVNLSDAQKVTDTEAQDIRGAAQGPSFRDEGDGSIDRITVGGDVAKVYEKAAGKISGYFPAKFHGDDIIGRPPQRIAALVQWPQTCFSETAHRIFTAVEESLT